MTFLRNHDLILIKALSFLSSINFFIRSFFTESYSKLLISTDMNKFSKMNYPRIRRMKKKKVATIGELAKR
jgi:hypothetical protein